MGTTRTGEESHPRWGIELLAEKGLADLPEPLRALRAAAVEGDVAWETKVTGAPDDLVADARGVRPQQPRRRGWWSRCRGSTDTLPAAPITGQVNVTMHVLWFDENKRKNFAYSSYQRRSLLMNEYDLERLVHVLHAGQETA